MCSIRAHRVNGVVVKIEGDPRSPIGRGRLCPKGVSGIMTHYDPNRVNVPLKRTNPEKGLDIDPGWVEITWEEALDTITQKLKECHEKDPRGLMCQGTTTATHSVFLVTRMFNFVFGTPNEWVAGGGLHCGNAAHLMGGLMHASWSLLPDFQKCEYAIYFGASKGHSAGHAANINAQMAADARARGMKLVVFDPMCNFAAAKANEWIPLRVGTDAAVALAMANVLVNELGIYDAPYLKAKTNAPYLVGPDGLHIRDEGGNPLVWDPVSGEARAYNDPTIQDFALEGTYEVRGQLCRPGFELLREHLKGYTPERAEEISTVPAGTIRRIATEFGQAAKIGSTVVIDGVELPYRPVAASFSGAPRAIRTPP
jgi:molybdopterin-containing oxidoreductase family molybdopterin binding subunit